MKFVLTLHFIDYQICVYLRLRRVVRLEKNYVFFGSPGCGYAFVGEVVCHNCKDGRSVFADIGIGDDFLCAQGEMMRKKQVLIALLRSVGPLALGAVGTYLATALPEVYRAICLS